MSGQVINIHGKCLDLLTNMMHGHCGIPERVQWLQNLANLSLGFKFKRCVKLQQNENDSKKNFK